MYNIKVNSDIGGLEELIDLTKFNIVNKENTVLINGKIDSNIDCIWDYDYKSYGVPIFGFNRVGKHIESFLFNKFKIRTPETFYDSKITNINQWLCFINNFNYEDEFIFKSLYGARGLGQILLNKKEFEQIVSDYNKINFFQEVSFKKSNGLESTLKYEPESVRPVKKDINSYLSQYRIGGDSEEKELSISNIKDFNNCILQKKIKVVSEYRMLMFYKQDPIIIKREVSDNNWQANSCLSNIGEHISFDYMREKDSKFIEIYKKIEKLFYYLDTSTISVDLYVDNELNWGVFEISCEYGIVYVPKYELFRKFNTALELKINDTIEKFNKE